MHNKDCNCEACQTPLAAIENPVPKRKSEIPFCPLKPLEVPRSQIMSENFGRLYGRNQEDTDSPPDPDPNNGEEADWFSVFTEDEGDK